MITTRFCYDINSGAFISQIECAEVFPTNSTDVTPALLEGKAYTWNGESWDETNAPVSPIPTPVILPVLSVTTVTGGLYNPATLELTIPVNTQISAICTLTYLGQTMTTFSGQFRMPVTAGKVARAFQKVIRTT